jgi:hypothetical protein
MTAHFPQPSIDAPPARWDPGIADAAVLGEHALTAYWPEAHAFAIALEQKTVARFHPQDAANFDGNGDLSFAGDFGLLLHDVLQIPYFIMNSLH